ncbi:MAG: hypothetical protein IID38_06105, partial [Planctomycetes bacterium]|nr:hypothetical protein [Planctomycetota bacterium]
MQAILDWDPTRLKLVGMKRPCGTCIGGTNIGLFCNEDSECPLSSCTGSDPCFECPSFDTYNWFASTLPNDCDPGNGLNAPCPGFPANDGDAFYVAFVQVLCDGESAPPAPVTPAGLWITTFLFEVLATDGGALVDLTLEFQTTKTLVAGAAPHPGANLLRNIGAPAQINIIQCQPPASVAAVGPRYLEIIPSAGTTPVALQVNGDPNDANWSCLTQYVQAPAGQCIGGSNNERPCTDDVDCTNGICQSFARLGPDVVKLTPAEWGTVYVRGANLQPSTFYEVRSDCGSVAGQTVSSAMPAALWFWGDTEKSSYPLGNFASSAATSEWPDKDGLDPDVGIDLTYFVNESGFSKAMLPSTEIPGPGLRWIFWLMTIKYEKGIEHLLAQYERIKNLGEAYVRGIAIFNDETETFQRLVQFDLKAPLHPTGRPFQVTIGEQHYYYFAVLYANSAFVRVKADLEHIKDPNRYEAFTCLVAGSRYNNSLPNLDRGADGHLIYAWKANTAPISYGREQELIAAGHMRPEEAWFQLKDIDSGDPVKTWSGSVQWNDFRQQWVMIVQQNPGEVWYAEGATPIGPWVYAKKIVTHNKYSFYLPTHHRFFDKDSGKTIY